MEAEYGSKEDIKTNSTFIKHREIKSVSEIGLDLGNQAYKDYLTEGFKSDVKNMSAADLFRKYGTHLPVHYKLGGKVELNANFNNRSETKMTEAEIQATVSYGFSSGSANAEKDKKKTTIQSNSRISCFAQGGSYIGGFSIDDIKYQLPQWRDSVNTDNYNLCGFFDGGLVPIWELLDPSDPNVQKLRDEFNAELQAEGSRLAGFNPPKGPIITDIMVLSLERGIEISDLPPGYEVVKELGKVSNSDPLDGAVEFNNGAGGAYIYLFYKTGWLTDAYAKNIANLRISMAEGKQPPKPNGYDRIPIDINSGAGGY